MLSKGSYQFTKAMLNSRRQGAGDGGVGEGGGGEGGGGEGGGKNGGGGGDGGDDDDDEEGKEEEGSVLAGSFAVVFGTLLSEAGLGAVAVDSAAEEAKEVARARSGGSRGSSVVGLAWFTRPPYA